MLCTIGQMMGSYISTFTMQKKIHTFWLENQKGRDHLEDLGVDG
jgi:hypothetical protein